MLYRAPVRLSGADLDAHAATNAVQSNSVALRYAASS